MRTVDKDHQRDHCREVKCMRKREEGIDNEQQRKTNWRERMRKVDNEQQRKKNGWKRERKEENERERGWGGRERKI